MPVTTPTYILQAYSAPSDLPSFIWSFFAKHQQHTNVMYPVAKKLLERESDGDPPTDSLWITCLTNHNSATDPTLDFVLSVTPGPQGAYPVFICTPTPIDQLKPDYILPRMQRVVEVLCTSIPTERVYSVFAPAPVAQAFAEAWTLRTGVELDADPEYYSAKLTHCTPNTLRDRRPTLPVDRSYIMRPAVPADIPAVAELCHGFAAVSEPFTLTHEAAVQEATYLVQNNMVWVYEIVDSEEPPQIASIVAATRSSESVAGITKVFTNPNTRNMGCAERLVRTVCDSLLESHESVILYVAHNNPAASKVYHKVGFQGLESPKAVADGVEDWLELGFDRKCVVLGHW